MSLLLPVLSLVLSLGHLGLLGNVEMVQHIIDTEGVFHGVEGLEVSVTEFNGDILLLGDVLVQLHE
jgi:hypothetical protein